MLIGTPPFYTIGHSNRPMAEFVKLLQDAGVTCVADVRRIPQSRANPQFALEALREELPRWQIGYRHMAALGGRRGREAGTVPSPNTLWENQSFRNYADYAATSPFQDGLRELRAIGHAQPTAIMCAEAVWWRCHRRILTDYLLAAGDIVFHILGSGAPQPAKATPGSRVEGGSVLYPRADQPAEGAAGNKET